MIVNPYDYDAIGAGLKKALEMPQEEQRYRNTILHQRLKRYNVEFWATDFIKELHKSVLETTGTNRQISIEKIAIRWSLHTEMLTGVYFYWIMMVLWWVFMEYQTRPYLMKRSEDF